MRLLDLYSGTESVARVAREMGWEVTTLDWSNKYKPDYCVDVLTFDFTVWPKGSFDMVFASVPCESYSQANRFRCPEEGNKVAYKTLEILKHLDPKWICIENPNSSLLWKTDIFGFLPLKRASYCMYSDWGYRKNTAFASNIDFTPQLCNKKCGNIIEHEGHLYHRECAKIGYSTNTPPGIQKTNKTKDILHRIPPDLVRLILGAAEAKPT
jgi:hypothetical protein